VLTADFLQSSNCINCEQATQKITIIYNHPNIYLTFAQWTPSLPSSPPQTPQTRRPLPQLISKSMVDVVTHSASSFDTRYPWSRRFVCSPIFGLFQQIDKYYSDPLFESSQRPRHTYHYYQRIASTASIIQSLHFSIIRVHRFH
jgi:hypothetical protein